nr:BACON domain-containing protein [uncultured Draconibacterium sp.]
MKKYTFYSKQLVILIVFLFVNSWQGVAQIVPDYTDGSFYKGFLPPEPSTYQVQQFGNVTVNKAKGLPVISIPLYTIKKENATIPIVLDYSGNGVKVNSVSGPVGVNWNLSAGGMVYRSVRGQADELDGWGWLDCQAELDDLQAISAYPAQHQSDIQDFFRDTHRWDTQPDIFGYQFGPYSGTFFIDDEGEVRKQEADPLKITMVQNIDPLTSKNLLYFIIKDGYGNTYTFGKKSDGSTRETTQTNTRHLPAGYYNKWSLAAVTGWKLEKVQTINGSLIEFTYEPYDHDLATSTVEGLKYAITDQQYVSVDYEAGRLSDIAEYETSRVEFEFKPLLLSKITYDNKIIDFKYRYISSKNDPYKMFLDSIIIRSMASTFKKGYVFEYYHANKDFLKKITELDENLESIGGNKYEIEYWNMSLCSSLNSLGQDYFGYHNGVTNNQSLIMRPSDVTRFTKPASSRDISESSIKNGIITSILYPTGGATYFQWESNKEKIEGSNNYKYAPGLRLQLVYDKDVDGRHYNKRFFQYSKLTGYTLTIGSTTHPVFMDDRRSSTGNDLKYCKLYSFDPDQKQNNVNDYYYGKIEETWIGSSENGYSVVSEEYSSPFALGTYYCPMIQNYKILKVNGGDTTTVKEEAYTYNWNNIYLHPYYLLGDTHLEKVSIYGSINVVTYYEGLILRYITLCKPLLSWKQVKEYLGGPSPVIRTYTYSHNTFGLLQRRNITNTETISELYRYPTEMQSGVYRSMKSNNMLNYPIEKTICKDNQVTNSSLITYKSVNNTYMPESVFQLEITSPLLLSDFEEFDGLAKDDNYATTPELTFNSYDSNGKVVLFSSKDGTTTTYIWDAYGQNPLHKTLSGNGTSLTESWTWYPLIGMKSHTNPMGVTKYYDYDAFGRLKNIRNDDEYIISRNYYHYYNQTTSDGEEDPNDPSEPDPYFSVSPSFLGFMAYGGTQSFTIESNTDWTITQSPTWVTLSKTSGSGNATIVVTCPSYSSSKRLDVIAIQSTSEGTLFSTKALAILQNY